MDLSRIPSNQHLENSPRLLASLDIYLRILEQQSLSLTSLTAHSQGGIIASNALPLLLVAYLALPLAGLLTGGYIDTRIPIAIVFIFIGCSHLTIKNNFHRRILICTFFGFLVFRSTLLAYDWHKYDYTIQEFTAAFKRMPSGSIMFVVSGSSEPTPNGELDQWHPPVLHLGSLATIQQKVFVTATKAFPPQQPIAVNKRFFLFHNPTHGFIADTVESTLGRLTNTSSISRQLAEILQQQSQSLTSLTAHSQGGIIVSNALRLVPPNSLTTNTVVNFNGAAVSPETWSQTVSHAGATTGIYQAHFLDTVPNIIGQGTFQSFSYHWIVFGFSVIVHGTKVKSAHNLCSLSEV